MLMLCGVNAFPINTGYNTSVKIVIRDVPSNTTPSNTTPSNTTPPSNTISTQDDYNKNFSVGSIVIMAFGSIIICSSIIQLRKCRSKYTNTHNKQTNPSPRIIV